MASAASGAPARCLYVVVCGNSGFAATRWIVGQSRAVDAIDVAFDTRARGHNRFVAGVPSSDCESAVLCAVEIYARTHRGRD